MSCGSCLAAFIMKLVGSPALYEQTGGYILQDCLCFVFVSCVGRGVGGGLVATMVL